MTTSLDVLTHRTLEGIIRSRISGVLAASTIRADEVHCRFHDNGQGLDIELVLPVAVSKRVKQALAVRVLDAVRNVGHTYGRVDVQITTYLHPALQSDADGGDR